MLSPEDLLAGSSVTHTVAVPAAVIDPVGGGAGSAPGTVRLRPLTVRDLQVITRAAKESDTLVAVLMIQRALVEPEMSVAQVTAMHAGLARYLLEQVNRVSGLRPTAEELDGAAGAPLTKAAFVLTREFGWTPHQIQELTLGQVLLYLEMLRQRGEP